MGDVGSLAIGGALGTVAILTKQEFLLPFIGGVFILEALSVMIQVASFKTNRPAHFQDVADTSSFRIERLERIKGRFSFCDRGCAVCAA